MAHSFYQGRDHRLGVTPGQADAEAGLALGHGGRANGGQQQAAGPQTAGQRHGPIRPAHDERNDLAGRAAEVPALPGQRLAEPVGAWPSSSRRRWGSAATIVQSGQGRRGGRGRTGRRVDVRPGTLDEPLDEQPAAGDESAGRAQGLAERADADQSPDLPRPEARPRPGRGRPVRPWHGPRRPGAWRRSGRPDRPARPSGARSPSMLNRPSVATSRRRYPAAWRQQALQGPSSRRGDRPARRPATAGSRPTGWRGSWRRRRPRRRRPTRAATVPKLAA